jgi:glutathione synthase/RimK-type ligase-like ATP-grasp enzyme
MILLWGSTNDRPLAEVRRVLQERSEPVLLVDQLRPLELEIELTVSGAVDGWIGSAGEIVAMRRLRAAYARPHEWRLVRSALEPCHDERIRRRAFLGQDALWSWLDVASIPVVNRPRAMGGCSAKPYQASMLAAAGFAVPETLVTSDRDAAERFWERHCTVVYKSISSARSIVSRITPEHRERLRDLQWCPVQFQAYVPGIDHRVHVVGEQVHCTQIRSAADDYRYAARSGEGVRLQPTSLPDDCAQRCVDLTRRMDLLVAGIDLRLTPDGTWYCFEVNPSPAFAFYDGPERSVAHALATYLQRLARG